MTPVGTAVHASTVLSAEPKTLGSDQGSMMVPVETDVHAASSTDPTAGKSSAMPVQPNPENPKDDLFLSQYPWTKTARICLDRVSPITIDIWTNTVKEYWCKQTSVGTAKDVRPSPTPTQTQCMRYGLQSNVKPEPMTEPEHNIVMQESGSPVPETDNSTEKLIKHTESLLEHARQISANHS